MPEEDDLAAEWEAMMAGSEKTNVVNTRELSQSEINSLLGFPDDPLINNNIPMRRTEKPIPPVLQEMLDVAPSIIYGSDEAFQAAISDLRVQRLRNPDSPFLIAPAPPTPRDLTLLHAQATTIGRINSRDFYRPRVDRFMEKEKNTYNAYHDFLGVESDNDLTNDVVSSSYPWKYFIRALENLSLTDAPININQEFTEKYGRARNKSVEHFRDGPASMYHEYTWFCTTKDGIKFTLSTESFNGRTVLQLKDNQADVEAIDELQKLIRKEVERLFVADVKGRTVSMNFTDFVISKKNNLKGLILDEELESKIFTPLHLFYEGDPKVKKYAMVLFGDPGTGKTLTTRKIIKETPEEVTTIVIPAGSLGEGNSINSLFAYARKLAPCQIIIDDGENLLGDNNIGKAMIAELDSFDDNEGIFMIITTNFPHRILPALSERPGRINLFAKFRRPKIERRKKFIIDWLKEQKEKIEESIIEILAKESEGATLDQLRGGLEEFTIHDDDIGAFIQAIRNSLTPPYRQPDESESRYVEGPMAKKFRRLARERMNAIAIDAHVNRRKRIRNNPGVEDSTVRRKNKKKRLSQLDLDNEGPSMENIIASIRRILEEEEEGY